MPIPKPRSGENQDKFISRCMDSIGGEYDDKKQAVAICFNTWRDYKKGKEKNSDWHKLNFNIPIKESVRDQDSFLIRGVAINETTTRNGVTYLAEELMPSAQSLKNKPILKDHVNSVDSIVGRTTENVRYDVVEKNVVFEGRIVDENIQEKIKNGLITSVSIGAMVKDIEQVDEKMVARGIEFVELSLVAVPADPEASFAKAICESLQLKQNESYDLEVVEKNDDKMMMVCPKCNKKMMGEEGMKCPECGTKMMAEDKMEDEKLKTELAEAKAKLSEIEMNKKIEEAIVKAKEETSKLYEEKIKALTEVKPEVKVENETKGIVSEKKELDALGLVLEKNNIGRGINFFAEKIDSQKFKRFGR